MNTKRLKAIWLWFIFLIIIGASLGWFGIMLDETLMQFWGEDYLTAPVWQAQENVNKAALIFQTIFPSMIGGGSGMLFAGKFLVFHKHAKKLAVETEKLMKEIPYTTTDENGLPVEVKPRVEVRTIYKDRIVEVMKPSKEDAKHKIFETNGIEFYKQGNKIIMLDTQSRSNIELAAVLQSYSIDFIDKLREQ